MTVAIDEDSRCPCGQLANGPEVDPFYQVRLCHDCYLESLPLCYCCDESPGTEDYGGGLHLCRECENKYNSGEWKP